MDCSPIAPPRSGRQQQSSSSLSSRKVPLLRQSLSVTIVSSRQLMERSVDILWAGIHALLHLWSGNEFESPTLTGDFFHLVICPPLPKVLLVPKPRLELGRWPSCFHQEQALKCKHYIQTGHARAGRCIRTF